MAANNSVRDSRTFRSVAMPIVAITPEAMKLTGAGKHMRFLFYWGSGSACALLFGRRPAHSFGLGDPARAGHGFDWLAALATRITKAEVTGRPGIPSAAACWYLRSGVTVCLMRRVVLHRYRRACL